MLPFGSSLALELVVLAVVGTTVLLLGYASRKRMRSLPPGPRPLPLVGNIFNLPRRHLGKGFLQLSQQYGDILHLNVLGHSMIVLGSYQMACDLLDKRSANYSDRPASTMANLAGFMNWLFAIMPYGRQWRQYRRAFHSQMNVDVIRWYEPTQLETSRNLLRKLLEDPNDLEKHLDMTFAATLMRVVYGIAVHEPENEYLALIERVTDVGEQIVAPGQFLVEAVPCLRYLPASFPGGGFKHWANVAKRDVNFAIDYVFEATKIAMGSSIVNDSLVTHLLSSGAHDDGGNREAEDIIKGIAASTYVAGADTSNIAMRAFFLAMTLYPEVQRRAQAEVDAIVGSERLPDFTDRPRLPYIHALIKELLRWHVVLPIGIPHSVVADDEYDGYWIPGGATVLVNAWGISRDPELYPHPDEFIPERFLTEDGALDAKGKDPAEYVFGFGRRICPGRHFAEASLFMLCTSVLWAFDIDVPVDSAGNRTRVEYRTADVLASRPHMYRYTIKARSREVEQLVRDGSWDPAM